MSEYAIPVDNATARAMRDKYGMGMHEAKSVLRRQALLDEIERATTIEELRLCLLKMMHFGSAT